ncbi:MAG: hypothetical protein L0Y72_26900 [Gemmataceae bacterium]|nr:hypothetical protein [Gemmataceae bacterium]
MIPPFAIASKVLFKKLFYQALAADSPRSADELERRHQEKGERTLVEIWNTLGNRQLAER